MGRRKSRKQNWSGNQDKQKSKQQNQRRNQMVPAYNVRRRHRGTYCVRKVVERCYFPTALEGDRGTTCCVRRRPREWKSLGARRPNLNLTKVISRYEPHRCLLCPCGFSSVATECLCLSPEEQVIQDHRFLPEKEAITYCETCAYENIHIDRPYMHTLCTVSRRHISGTILWLKVSALHSTVGEAVLIVEYF